MDFVTFVINRFSVFIRRHQNRANVKDIKQFAFLLFGSVLQRLRRWIYHREVLGSTRPEVVSTIDVKLTFLNVFLIRSLKTCFYVIYFL